MRVLLVDGRPGQLAGWILGDGPFKQWVPTVDYLDLLVAATARGEVLNMKDVGLQGAGSAYIAQLDFAQIVGQGPPPPA